MLSPICSGSSCKHSKLRTHLQLRGGYRHLCVSPAVGKDLKLHAQNSKILFLNFSTNCTYFMINFSSNEVLWYLCCQDINFWGNVYPTYVALPYLRRTHGKIVVNASVESWLPLPRMSLYAVSICYISLAGDSLNLLSNFNYKVCIGWL